MNDLKYRYITIEGCIGAGKTTLARMLSADFHTRLILEQFEENSFLPKFYQDPARYAFPLELSFLADRFQQLKNQVINLDMFHPHIVSDYHIQKSLIFARKTLQSDEFSLFMRLYQIMIAQLPVPELFVYLYLPVDRLLANIKKRGRPYEQSITADYLSLIQESYFEFIRQQNNLRVVVIDTRSIDFVENRADYEWLVSVINAEYPIGVTTIS
ncbi:MAG: deoxynucleoside kinase [Bacteroidales bacterium]